MHCYLPGLLDAQGVQTTHTNSFHPSFPVPQLAFLARFVEPFMSSRDPYFAELG
jgi:hypothetical protein